LTLVDHEAIFLGTVAEVSVTIISVATDVGLRAELIRTRARAALE
jgi:hypothetical protein